MSWRRSVGASSTSSPSATSPLWIQHSARRVVAQRAHRQRAGDPLRPDRSHRARPADRRTAADRVEPAAVHLLGVSSSRSASTSSPAPSSMVFAAPAAQAEANVSSARAGGRRGWRAPSRPSAPGAARRRRRSSRGSATALPRLVRRDQRRDRPAPRARAARASELLGHAASLAVGAMTRHRPPAAGGRMTVHRTRGRVGDEIYLPAARRWKRVRFSIFLCFFLRMRLRRFLISEPMGGRRLAACSACETRTAYAVGSGAGLDLATPGSKGRCSDQLNYPRRSQPRSARATSGPDVRRRAAARTV